MMQMVQGGWQRPFVGFVLVWVCLAMASTARAGVCTFCEGSYRVTCSVGSCKSSFSNQRCGPSGATVHNCAPMEVYCCGAYLVGRHCDFCGIYDARLESKPAKSCRAPLVVGRGATALSVSRQTPASPRHTRVVGRGSRANRER